MCFSRKTPPKGFSFTPTADISLFTVAFSSHDSEKYSLWFYYQDYKSEVFRDRGHFFNEDALLAL